MSYLKKILNGIYKLYCVILLKIATWPVSNRIRIKIYKHLGIKIGKDTYIGTDLEIIDYSALNLIVIGDRVTISSRVTLVVSSGPNNSKLKNIYPRKIGKIVIEDDAWVGTGVTILPGITVGKMSIIGAGAVVTKDVPPFTIVAGVPAKIIKRIGEKKHEDYS